MQSNSSDLPRSFISVEDAVKIINSHSAGTPTVDLRRLVKGITYIQRSNNFNIFLAKKQGGNLVPCGEVPTMLRSNYDVEYLKKAIIDKYAEMTGHQFDEAAHRVKAVSSTIEEGNSVGRPVKSRGIAKPGDEIGKAIADVKSIGNMGLMQ